MVLEFLGCHLTESELTALIRPDEIGGTALRQLASLEVLGFAVTVSVGTERDLREVVTAGNPLVVPVYTAHFPAYPLPSTWENHAVVVAGATRRQVSVFDPSRDNAPDLVPMVQFDRAWRARGYRMARLTRIPAP